VVQLTGGQIFQRTPSLELAAEADVSKDEFFVGHSEPNIDPDTYSAMETHDNNPDASTAPTPLVSPPENHSPEPAIADIPTSQNMMGVEETSTPTLSQELLNALYQESLQNSPAESSTSEEIRSTSFCNTSVSEPKQPFRKIVYTEKLSKPALLTSLFFARALRSLGTTEPKANAAPQSPNSKAVALIESHASPQSPNSSKAVALIEPCAEETSSLAQDDKTPMMSTKLKVAERSSKLNS
jgi:hypothetical protein